MKVFFSFPYFLSLAILNSLPPRPLPPHSILQGLSIYPSSWEKMQQELTWVLEKIMFSFIVGGSLLAVMDFYCIIQDYNVILWCWSHMSTHRHLPPLINFLWRQTALSGKSQGRFPMPVLLIHVITLKLVIPSIYISPRAPQQRCIFPWALAVPYKFYLEKYVSKTIPILTRNSLSF